MYRPYNAFKKVIAVIQGYFIYGDVEALQNL